MSQYNRLQALNFIIGSFKNPARYEALGAPFQTLVNAALDLDFGYMLSANFMDEGGRMGEGYYYDEDAFEHIFESLCSAQNIPFEREMLLADFVDEYMVAQQKKKKKNGLIE